MAEGTLVNELFSSALIDDGEKFTNLLIESKLNITASLWLYSEENETWRLVIGMPKVKEKGPSQAYTKLQSILKKFYDEHSAFDTETGTTHNPFRPRIYLPDISVMDSTDPFLKTLHNKLGPDIRDAQLHNLRIGDYYVENAIIYWLK